MTNQLFLSFPTLRQEPVRGREIGDNTRHLCSRCLILIKKDDEGRKKTRSVRKRRQLVFQDEDKGERDRQFWESQRETPAVCTQHRDRQTLGNWWGLWGRRQERCLSRGDEKMFFKERGKPSSPSPLNSLSSPGSS